MQDKLQKYMTAQAPRYTSYPTAPHFNDAVGGAQYGDWLGRLNPTQPISLYLHVPFCRKVCWYCGCNMKLASRYEPIAVYIDDLLAEIDLIAGALPGRMTISHLHWGGGTPTALTPDDMERTMDAVADRFDFADDAEIALESDPRTLSDEMIRRAGKLGFNRASFGVQEFDPAVQAAINRIQPPEMVERSVSGLRAVGVEAINFDLIYGLPRQTVDTIVDTVDKALDMRPNRIALFGYAHVPWMAKKQRMINEDELPGAAGRLAQATAAADRLLAKGYVPIGLDHFAAPDDTMATALKERTLRRNFQGYTTDQADTMIGLGATSIGRTPFGYVQNVAETGAWARSVRAGELPIGKGYAFRDDDDLRGRLIEQLMCYGEVDLDVMRQSEQAPADRFAAELEALEPMQADGLLSYDGAVLKVTEAGLPLVRIVAAAFDRYRHASGARHSVAV